MTEKANNSPKETPKDKLRSKYANTFKLFDDEGPTVPVEITNVGKLDFNIEDLDPNKNKITTEANSTAESTTKSTATTKKESKPKINSNLFDIHEEETKPVEVTNVGKLKFNIKDLDPNKNEKDTNPNTESKKESSPTTENQEENKDISSKFDNLGFSMNSKLSSEQKKDELNNSSITKHYKVLKFFGRLSSTILDQAIILGLTFLYFLFLIKPNMIKTPYSYIEGVTDFIINDNSNFKSLLIGYFLIAVVYYTVFNIIIKSTPFNYLLGYRIYRNDNLASPIILIFRNILMITLNLFLLFPYLFMIVSDDKQTIYDKIFKTYFLKEN